MFGKENNGFKLINVIPLEEYKSTGIYLIHEETGLEVFHVYNDDDENLFSFMFKTLPNDDTGVFHILEHTVLCGSKNFPLKDPFKQLSKQSVNTFLNAMTSNDSTMYPAASISEEDYFNLMSVYADAVFNPILNKNSFMQEGHHLELDNDGNPTISGVVYNEMKGAMSSVNRIKHKEITKTLFANTPYQYESGGDPNAIPSLTYEDFCDTYKKHYNPSNCRLFLYGNIPTAKQLNFLNKRILSKYKGKLNKITQQISPEIFNSPKYVNCQLPASNEDSVVINWRIDNITDSYSEVSLKFLVLLLLGNEGSPLYEKLINSGLGKDIYLNYYAKHNSCVISVGFTGTDIKDSKKIEKLILDTIENLATDGIDNNHIEIAQNSIEFINRQITREQCQYPIAIMRKVFSSWLWDRSPADYLNDIQAFSQIRKKIKETNGKWIQDLLKNVLLDNPNRSCVSFESSDDYDVKYKEKEALNIKNAVATLGIEANTKIKQINKQLLDYQKREDSEKLKNLIPRINIKDLKPNMRIYPIAEKMINNVNFIGLEQETKGIVYLKVYYPIDVLPAEDIVFLSFFGSLYTSFGFSNENWIDSSIRAGKVSNIFMSSIRDFSLSMDTLKKLGIDSLSDKEIKDYLYKYDKILGRHTLCYKMAFLEENLQEAIKVMFDCINTSDFTDIERLKILYDEYKIEFLESLVQNASQYVSKRATCKNSRYDAIDEITDGLSQINLINLLDSMTSEEIVKKMQEIHSKFINSGAYVAVIGQKHNIDKVEAVITDYIKDYPIIKAPLQIDNEEFYKLTTLPGQEKEESSSQTELIKLNTRAGYTSLAFNLQNFKKSPEVLYLINKYLSDGVLWDKIRVNNGAYGAWVTYTDQDCIIFSSYRDPNPIKSKDLFYESIKEALNIQITQKDVDMIKTSRFGKLNAPMSPLNKGITQLIRRLTCITNEDIKNNWKIFFEVTSEDIKETLKLYEESFKDTKTAVIFNKFEENGRKIITLGL